MNDSVVTVRMPKGLLLDLKDLTEKHNYMDISEAIRSILRKEYMESYIKKNEKE